MNSLTILYATDDMNSRLHTASAARNWDVFCPASINEALAMVVYYAPHAIVIDGDSDWLNELALNVTNVTGPSARLHDIVVRLADAPLAIDAPDYISYHELPSAITPDELARTLVVLDAERMSGRCFEPQFGAA
jgi:hypothetical protein